MTTTKTRTETILQTALTAVVLTLCGACDVDSDEFSFDAEQEFRPGGWGGGIGFNNGYHWAWHWSTDGGLLDGSELASVSVVNPAGGLMQLESVWSEDGRLYGSIGVRQVSGADFLGSVWHIDSYRALGTEVYSEDRVLTGVDVSGSVDLYEFTFSAPNPNAGQTMCGVDSMAVVVDDLYLDSDGTVSGRNDTLLFGCERGGVAKAVQWGYEPWGPAGNRGFQTAIRMVVADYCGDGVAHTQEGVPLLVGDVWGVNTQPLVAMTDAAWDKDGATCLLVPRDSSIDREDVPCSNELPMCTLDPTLEVGGAMLASWGL